MTRADVVYQVVIYTIVTLFTICCVIPLLYVIGMSLTSEGEMIQKNYFVIIPEQPTLKAYEYVFNQFNFWNSMGISVARTILGVAGHAGVRDSGRVHHGQAGNAPASAVS